jgi:hypothetical protein
MLMKVPSFQFRSLELLHSLSSLAGRIIAATVTCATVAAVLLREQRTGNMHHLSRAAVYKTHITDTVQQQTTPPAGKSFPLMVE